MLTLGPLSSGVLGLVSSSSGYQNETAIAMAPHLRFSPPPIHTHSVRRGSDARMCLEIVSRCETLVLRPDPFRWFPGFELFWANMWFLRSDRMHNPLQQVMHTPSTNRDGRMVRAPASRSGRSGNPDPKGSIPGQVKPMTLKLILVTS